MQKILCFLLSVLVTGTDGVPFVGCLIKNPCTQVCTNQLLGVACSCYPGWSVDPRDRNNCVVVEIKCRAGYQSILGKCRDIDECVSSRPCNQGCDNTEGSYQCTCSNGFHISSNDRNTCVPSVASCNAGYRPDPANTLRCIDIDECQTNRPCDQSCRNYEGGYRCYCQLGYEVNAIDRNRCNEIQVCSSLIDIIFVIDSSGSLGVVNNDIQLSFASKLVSHFQVGNSQARIGAILFSDTVEKLFDLNRYGTTNEVAQTQTWNFIEKQNDKQRHVGPFKDFQFSYDPPPGLLAVNWSHVQAGEWAILRAPYHNGGTKTNVVLDYIVNRKSFGEAAGGRSNARDIVVVFTDGQSKDPALTAAASDRLKNQNVRVVTVGLGNAVDVQELNRVASSRSDVFLSPAFEDIDYIEQQLSQRVCNY